MSGYNIIDSKSGKHDNIGKIIRLARIKAIEILRYGGYRFGFLGYGYGSHHALSRAVRTSGFISSRTGTRSARGRR